MLDWLTNWLLDRKYGKAHTLLERLLRAHFKCDGGILAINKDGIMISAGMPDAQNAEMSFADGRISLSVDHCDINELNIMNGKVNVKPVDASTLRGLQNSEAQR
jgi:hypothetical protein